MAINYKDLGLKIGARRREMKISQQKLGELVHVSASHISAIETANKKPSLETIVEIAKKLNLNMGYLFNDVIYKEPDEAILEKFKLCSIENQKRIIKIVDVFVEEEKLEK